MWAEGGGAVRQSEGANKGGEGERDAAGKAARGGACRGGLGVRGVAPTTPNRPEESVAVADGPGYLDFGPRR